MLDDLFDPSWRLRLPRRWDGKNLSRQGTITSAFRVVAGSLDGVGPRWAGYATTVDAGHLWIGRQSVWVAAIELAAARDPLTTERHVLDRDVTVVPVSTRSGATLEWALRADALDGVLARLGPVAH